MILPRARGVIGDNGMEQEEQIRQHGSIFPREKTLKANITNMERKQRFSTLASSLLHKVNKKHLEGNRRSPSKSLGIHGLMKSSIRSDNKDFVADFGGDSRKIRHIGISSSYYLSDKNVPMTSARICRSRLNRRCLKTSSVSKIPTVSDIEKLTYKLYMRNRPDIPRRMADDPPFSHSKMHKYFSSKCRHRYRHGEEPSPCDFKVRKQVFNMEDTGNNIVKRILALPKIKFG
mmetsp:Transcript_28210/g.38979  ORF Transcript_28210/g.38979 Transcript_28210/m.38979 type:complete len:232 (+) Transcript_28210:137-832(+)